LLRFWDELDEQGQAQLSRQLASVDFDQIAALYGQAGETHDWAALARRAAPPPAVRLADRKHGAVIRVGGASFTADEACRRGAEALAAGQVGVLLVAGGQGSRLGFDRPKSLYPIGPVSGASLLQVHLQKALATAGKYGAAVPVYIMSSPATHDEQVRFLAEKERFGLPEKDVIVFCQGTMPAVDATTGRLLLAEKNSLFLSPDGHGGMVSALAASGAAADMRRRGIEHLFYLQVDNPLAPICDPELIGAHLLAESELTSIAVAKQSPRDKLGNFLASDGRVHVIEYSDLPDDVAERRDSAGGLVFWAGSIAIHVFCLSLLERAQQKSSGLPFHIARKKVPYLDESGRRVEPAAANALKFERFIFDLLPMSDNALVVEYAEQDVFAPLKNAPGADRDTPEYVQKMMIDLHTSWLRSAGTRVVDGVQVEISPLWALDAEDVAAREDRPREISVATYLRE
jgi:UDP-N-acetylglucosamine/UDP-N-acetylgalactosamine diphosphorylase